MSETTPIPWDQLLTDIHKRQVLPILGPSLVTVSAEGRSLPLLDAIVPDFVRAHGIEERTGMTLHEAACDFFVKHGHENDRRMEIYNTVTRLVAEREDGPLPKPLLDLASITDFDVFITTTFDGFFTRALAEKRPGWTPGKGRAVLHPTSVVDVPQPLPGTFLYHILGSTDKHASFAIWEEDYMEYLAALLMGPQDNLKNLISLLRNRSLLLIGSPFSDWFVRFFLFIAKRSHIAVRNPSTGAFLADNLSPNHPLVFYFDKVIRSPRVLPMDPCEFVAELGRRWAAKYALSTDELIASLPAEMPRGYVFISYASEDKKAAFSMALGLHHAGIPVWLDRVRLHVGTDWERTLRLAIKNRAALFISLISTTTEKLAADAVDAPDDKNAERVVLKERLWASERQDPALIFYIPVLISPITETFELRTLKGEPVSLPSLQAAEIPGGQVTPAFVRVIGVYMEKYRELGEVPA